MLSAAMLLDYLGERDAAKSIRQGVEQVYRAGDVLTPDAGGTATTSEFAAAILDRI